MTDEKLADMHRLLAEYHRGLGKAAVLEVVQQYHTDLAQRLSEEAVLIPRRTAIVERLHERELQEARLRINRIGRRTIICTVTNTARPRNRESPEERDRSHVRLLAAVQDGFQKNDLKRSFYAR
jgi:hypothetical protein